MFSLSMTGEEGGLQFVHGQTLAFALPGLSILEGAKVCPWDRCALCLQGCGCALSLTGNDRGRERGRERERERERNREGEKQ